MQIIIKKSPQEMLDRIGLDTKQIQRVKMAIYKAVSESFEKRRETMNEPEKNRRIDFCFKEVLRLRCDCEFAIREIEHHLPSSLRLFLIGLEYKPSERLIAGHQTIG